LSSILESNFLLKGFILLLSCLYNAKATLSPQKKITFLFKEER
jgi:hypothetical protein